MNRIHSTLIALVIGAAATAGAYAAVHTVRLGQKVPAPTVSKHAVAVRKAKLAAWHRSLAAALAKRPPKLPKVPHYAPVPVQAAPPAVAAAPAAPPVTYVQAPTVVKYKRATTPTTTRGTSWHDDGSGDDNSGDGGGD